jgi:hypothetical protein
MASKTRIITINPGEEVIIRVNSTKHVTLEFSGSILTAFEEGGVLYTRHEDQKSSDEIICNEVEAGGDEETQLMETQTQLDYPETPTPPFVRYFAGGGFDTVNEKHLSRMEMEDIAELQMDLFGSMDAGDTQIDV